MIFYKIFLFLTYHVFPLKNVLSGLAPLARRWAGAAADNYGEVRFGGLPATPQRALALRETVQGVCDILTGAVPELAR